MKDRGRYLLVTWDGAGNLPPERSLVRALIARGHHVDVLAHPSVRERFELDGAVFHELVTPPPHDAVEAIDPANEMQRTIDNLFFARGFRDDTATTIEACRPDVMLVDAALTYGLLAARASGLPSVALWHSLYGLVVGGPFADLFNSRLGEINRFAVDHGIEPFASHRALLEASEAVLVFTYEPFDMAHGLPSNVCHVGPLRSTDPEATESWQRSRPGDALVVVGLSTSNMHQHALLQKLCDALAELPVEALVTTGPAISPGSLRTGANTTAVEFVSHDAVLSESRLLVTHAGHGTVAAGLTHGVPMLCIPMGRDQPAVAGRVAQLGLGAVVHQDAPTADLRTAVQALLGDEETLSRSRDFVRWVSAHAGMEEAVRRAEGLLGRSGRTDAQN